eukprot:UN09566
MGISSHTKRMLYKSSPKLVHRIELHNRKTFARSEMCFIPLPRHHPRQCFESFVSSATRRGMS